MHIQPEPFDPAAESRGRTYRNVERAKSEARRVRFRRVVVPLALLGLFAFGPPRAMSSVAARTPEAVSFDLWSPPVRPQGCDAVGADLVLVDVSRSMRTAFPAVRRELEGYLDTAARCRLVILATFGTTADIAAAEFLTDPQARERLKQTVRALRANQADTNFDEAARLIEWALARLNSAYGEAELNVVVKVLSDHQPSPGPGKRPFDLREYLRKRFPQTDLQMTQVAAQIPGTSAPTVTVTSGEGVVIARAPLEKLREVLGVRGQSAGPAPSSPDPLSPPPSSERWQQRAAAGGAWAAAHALPLAAVGVVLALLGFLAAVHRVRRKFPPPPLPGGPAQDTAPVLERAPARLLVRELEWTNGPEGRRVQHLLGEKAIPIGPNVPVVFGSDPLATWVVHSALTRKHGELFRITCAAGPALRVRGAPEVLVNGQKLSGAERRFDASQPLRIEFGPMKWEIRLEVARDRSGEADELFTTAGAAGNRV
jgi:hypothetical protein